jgi:hypothetical protein
MPALIPLLEALGLLAVVFAVGIGIGFSLSRLSGRRAPRRARQARPAPILSPAPHEETPSVPPPEAAPQTIAAAHAPVELVAAEPVVSEPILMTIRSEPEATPLSGPQPAFLVRPRYHFNPYGIVSVTRPASDQPSS